MTLFPQRSPEGFDGLLHVGRITTALPALAPRDAFSDPATTASAPSVSSKKPSDAPAAVVNPEAGSAQGRIQKRGANLGNLLRPTLNPSGEGGTRPVQDVPQVEPEGSDVELGKEQP